ncbi:hypothetical protein CERSUDRAFT_74323 [Gelatoporia subvermispora B]|uniref:Uncharacterized protein n=1 Tax=Ceriporiopsis subvermispora (strain B) TaxID=914234 RepID=M2RD01_CERS8|nr:hypothetical protein CERSUDRAFT_74323 [Gelatoporia subvermispora B]
MRRLELDGERPTYHNDIIRKYPIRDTECTLAMHHSEARVWQALCEDLHHRKGLGGEWKEEFLQDICRELDNCVSDARSRIDRDPDDASILHQQRRRVAVYYQFRDLLSQAMPPSNFGRLSRAEAELLEREFASPQVQFWLASGQPGRIRQVANHIIHQYVSELGDPLNAESDTEFEERKGTLRNRAARTRLIRRLDETDQDCRIRLQGIPGLRAEIGKFPMSANARAQGPDLSRVKSAARRALSRLLLVSTRYNFAARVDMGETKWLPNESDLLDREYASHEVQSILATGEIGSLRKAANFIAMKYEKVLGKLRPAETEADFVVRKASFKSRTTRAKMTILPAETPEEYATRMKGIATRIYTWVKYQSDGRVSRAPPSLEDAPVQHVHRLTGWDVYKRERGSVLTAEGITVTPGAIQEWTALARAEFEALSQDIKVGWKKKADEENGANEERQEAKNTISLEAPDEETIAKRDTECIKLEDQINNVLQKVNVRTGYVSFSITGGINQNGRLRAFIDKYGRDFEQKLEGLGERILERLCNLFEAFMIDCFEWEAEKESENNEGEPKTPPERGVFIEPSTMGSTASISGLSTVSTTASTVSQESSTPTESSAGASMTLAAHTSAASGNAVLPSSLCENIALVVHSGDTATPAKSLDSNVRPGTLGPSTPSSRSSSTPKVPKHFSPFKSVSTVNPEADEPTPRPLKPFSPFKSVPGESGARLTTPVKLSIHSSASVELASPGINIAEGTTHPVTPVKLSLQATAAIEPRRTVPGVTRDHDVATSRRGREEPVTDRVVEDGDATPCPQKITRAKTKMVSKASKNVAPKVSPRKTRSTKQDIQERVTRSRKASARALQQDPYISHAWLVVTRQGARAGAKGLNRCIFLLANVQSPSLLHSTFKMPTYSEVLKRIAKEGADLRKPTETCLCRECKRPLPVRVAYSERNAGKWVGVCFECDKATVPSQTSPSPEHRQRIEAVRALDRMELDDRRMARALQRAENRQAKLLKSPQTPKTPRTLRTPRAVGSDSEPGTPETPRTGPRASKVPHTPKTPRTLKTSRTPKTPRTPKTSTTATVPLASSQPGRRESSPIKLVSDGEGADMNRKDTRLMASYELELTDEEVDGIPRTIVKDLGTQTSYMLPLPNTASKTKFLKGRKTTNKRVAENDEPESNSNDIMPAGEGHKRKSIKLAGRDDVNTAETIVISSDSEEEEPAASAQVKVPAMVVEDSRGESIGVSESDQEDGPHLLKSHDNRQRLVRVVIWTGTEEKRYAKVEKTFAYLGLVDLGQLVHGPLNLPPETHIELWDKAESSWVGVLTSQSPYWVGVETKGIWGRVVGSGAVGTDFWEEMKRIQTVMRGLLELISQCAYHGIDLEDVVTQADVDKHTKCHCAAAVDAINGKLSHATARAVEVLRGFRDRGGQTYSARRVPSRTRFCRVENLDLGPPAMRVEALHWLDVMSVDRVPMSVLVVGYLTECTGIGLRLQVFADEDRGGLARVGLRELSDGTYWLPWEPQTSKVLDCTSQPAEGLWGDLEMLNEVDQSNLRVDSVVACEPRGGIYIRVEVYASAWRYMHPRGGTCIRADWLRSVVFVTWNSSGRWFDSLQCDPFILFCQPKSPTALRRGDFVDVTFTVNVQYSFNKKFSCTVSHFAVHNVLRLMRYQDVQVILPDIVNIDQLDTPTESVVGLPPNNEDQVMVPQVAFQGLSDDVPMHTASSSQSGTNLPHTMNEMRIADGATL